VVANGAGFMAPDPTGQYLYSVYYGAAASVTNIVALAVDPSTGSLSQIGFSVPFTTNVTTAACDPSGAFLFLGNFGSNTVGSWSDLTSFTIATSGANAGIISPSGQGTQFPWMAPGNGELAIVE